MSVEMRQFIEADIDGLRGQSGFNSEARDKQHKLTEIVENQRRARHGFPSIALLKVGLAGKGFTASQVVDDTLHRRYIEETGAYPEYAAVLFLKICSSDFPDLFLGVLMVSYNSELELE